MHGLMENEKFIGREAGWHHLGEVSQDWKTVREGMIRIGADFPYRKEPVYYGFQNRTIFGDVTEMRPISNKFAIIRGATAKSPEMPIGIVGGDFEPIQNLDIADSVDVLSDIWTPATVGVIEDGAGLFLSLAAGRFEIKGEQVDLFFSLYNNNGGGKSLKLVLTPVRMVCQNTVISGLKAAYVSVDIIHQAGAKDSMASRLKMLKQVQNAKEVTFEAFSAMANTALSTEEFDSMLQVVYPYPAKPKSTDVLDLPSPEMAQFQALLEKGANARDRWEWNKSRVDAQRNGAQFLYEKINDEYPNIARTQWAAYNAVVELADWRPGEESRYLDAMFGKRAAEKEKAFAYLTR